MNHSGNSGPAKKATAPAMSSTLKPGAPAVAGSNMVPAAKSAAPGAAPPQAMKTTAMELFRIAKAELKISDLKSAELQPKASLFAELVESSQPSVRLGMLTRCAIPGCDVHLIDENRNIMAHFPEGEAVPPGFEKARSMVNNLPPKFLAIIVYTNKTEALLPNGSTVPYP
ncbi:MAG: hypothetical protein J0L82_19275 [Deltaproteobacteria bacterium]|nr:hypothetical protein [Deltaproteobacteria bacterium]